MKLETKAVEKPWGRRDIPERFGDYGDRRIGEIWFVPEGSATPDILAKYLFTSEKLSIQVHPSDAQARERSLPHGKEECWVVLDAEEDARLGIGLLEQVSSEELREAALSGAIEEMMDWKPVRRGDVFYIPAGTVHAIGAGVTLAEVQQNIDLTYRLYDYGRPRELHLDDGIAVSAPAPYDMARHEHIGFDAPRRLVDGPFFTLDLVMAGDHGGDASPQLVLPLEGEAASGGETARAGESIAIAAGAPLTLSEGACALVARPLPA